MLCTELLLPQFLAIIVSISTIEPLVGIGADLGFNVTTMHQQSPDYRPF
jgi:hypothetical protein